MLGLAVISSVMLSFGYLGWRLLFGGVVVWGIGDGLPNGMASYDGYSIIVPDN